MQFNGFGKGAVGFYTDLAANNSRDWWRANKSRYDNEVRGPLEALLEDLAAEFGEAKVFRPNRDTRFSKDKAPYKTNAAAVVHGSDGASLYLGLSAEGLHVGGGAYGLERDQLARYRAAVDGDKAGEQLESIVADLRKAKATVEGRTTLKTAPRGVSPDHPRIELLRANGVFGMWAHPPKPWLYTTKARDQVVEHWHAVEPLNDWLVCHVGPTSLTR